MIALPDVNVLLCLAWANHPHHSAAHGWFARESSSGWATCLLTQSAFLRLSMNPVVVGVSIDARAARFLLENLVAHPTHQFADAAPALTAHPFDDLLPKLGGYRQVSDATLLHVARFHGMKLVTFDQSLPAICPWPDTLEVLAP